jgi:hypothetical protein
MDLYIFDFDDTLAVTDSLVKIHRGEEVIKMTSREFAEFSMQEGDLVDFDDFQRAEGTLIKDTADRMLEAMADVGSSNVFIVTARAVGGPVEEWLTKELGMSPQVVATNGSEGKKPWLLNQLGLQEYSCVIVYEDCTHNIRDLKDAVDEFNATNSAAIEYSAMCILPNQSIVKAESRWRPENLITEWDFREITKKFLRKTW